MSDTYLLLRDDFRIGLVIIPRGAVLAWGEANFNSTLVIFLKYVFIEMLDKLITYIVCWYKILYQVLPVAWTNRITTRRYRDS